MSRIRPFLLSLTVLLAVTVARADGLTLVTEESPPFNMLVKGKIVGIAADKVAELMKRARLPYTVDILPWARAYQMALDKPNTCVFSTTRTPEREAHFKWVGPLAFNSWVMYGLAERQLRLATLDDARTLRIGTYNADVRDIFLRSKGFKVDTARNDALNPRKLLMGRIDLWASGPFEANTQILANGWADRIVPVLTFNRVELYLACHAGMPNELTDRLNVLVNTMNNDGSATQIERHYEHWPNMAP
jgi:polar amino acid transport system substrate-binding protein